MLLLGLLPGELGRFNVGSRRLELVAILRAQRGARPHLVANQPGCLIEDHCGVMDTAKTPVW
jgi:hypothetical protein